MEKINLITEENEPKIFKSLKRIAEYYLRASKYITRYMKDYTEEVIYKRYTTKLPDSFKSEPNDFLVLRVGKYDFKNKKLWCGPNGVPDPVLKKMYTNIEVECHIDQKGNVLAVYLR